MTQIDILTYLKNEKFFKSLEKNFIAVEGIDGCGKSTIIRKFQQYVWLHDTEHKRKLKKIIFSKFPHNTEIEGVIRSILSPESKYDEDSRRTLLLNLFSSDIIMGITDLRTMIENDDTHILLDRYIFSTLAYQGLYFSMDDILDRFNNSVHFPENIIYFKTDPKVAMERITKRGYDKDIHEKLDFLERVNKEYECLFEYMHDSKDTFARFAFPKFNLYTIDTNNKDENEVLKEFTDIINSIIDSKNKE